MIRLQPSMRINIKTLMGRDMVAGGTIIIPSASRMLETTRSISRKGNKMTNPIVNPTRNSLSMKAGISLRSDTGRQGKDPAVLCERVRQSISASICAGLRGQHAELAVLSLDPRLENRVAAQGAAGHNLIAADPRLAEQLLTALAPLVDRMLRQGRTPVVLCAGSIRRALVALTRRTLPQLAVISVDEVPLRMALTSFDVVRLQDADQLEPVG